MFRRLAAENLTQVHEFSAVKTARALGQVVNMNARHVHDLTPPSGRVTARWL